ncbi:MAG: kinase [Candidatus Rokubacteria bacterium]|nr:kinase [Candidatus Rokubacteria bacterium]
MIISRTPFRVSFFGGGTDYPVWFREHGGAVLATTINKYCYISCRYLPPFFSHRSRVVWSQIELVQAREEIQHPVVREALGVLGVTEGIELHHQGDLPARTGLGSSSAFTVGVLNALYGLRGIMPAKEQLAREAILIEQERLKEHVGCQDQVIAAYGGFNRIDFWGDSGFRPSPIMIPWERLNELQDRLMLFFTGLSRTASDIAATQVSASPHKARELRVMHQMVDEAINILKSPQGLDDFGRLLDESWQLKRSLTDRISTPFIDDLYARARRAGCTGGKLIGAGGGGFLLLFTPPEAQAAVAAALPGLLRVPFRFESVGSHVIFYERPDLPAGRT